MGVEGSDGLAPAWLFAHLEVLLPTWGSGPIEFEPEPLVNYAEALPRASATDVRAAAYRPRPRWGSAWPTAWRQSVNSAVSAASASGLGRWTGLWSWGEALRYRGARGGPACF